MFKIDLRNGKSFTCDLDEIVLDAAKRSGISLEYSCLSGRCRSCISKSLSGATRDLQKDLVLTEEEKSNGYFLSCCATPTSDLRLDVEDLSNYNLPKPKTLPAKIDSLKPRSKDVLEVVLRLPPQSGFSYKAGQYVKIIRGSVRRSYSIANFSPNSAKIMFYIKSYLGGEMSRYWFEKAKINDLLRIEGPLGTFFFRGDDVKDIIFLATGTGIAPINSMIEHFKLNPHIVSNKQITLLWGSRVKEDLFISSTDLTQLINLEYTPVLSRQNDNWEGEMGYVQDVLIKKIEKFDQAQVYACGNDNMITSAKNLLVQNGLAKNNFFSDSFVCSK
tara:strand:- start:1679 stop:2671 length:993 start_codon:yes stop_codon:yes gene_type:complete